MRHTSRGATIKISLYLVVLLSILYVNVPLGRASRKTFAWTTIRYKTNAASLPQARGICPGLTDTTKPALVVARVEADGDPTWLDSLAQSYHHCIYQADGSLDYLQVPANRGHEAMAYLTFLIDNYHHIPSAGAVFVHGSRFSWHNDHRDYDNQALLSMLNVSSALSTTGYHNLRCDWSVSTCSKNGSPPPGSMETRIRGTLEPWNARVASDRALPLAFRLLFGGNNIASLQKDGTQLQLGRHDVLRAQCCAQFVVSRERIWQHSQEEYAALRQWLLDDDIAPRDDRVAGRILSYMWHILFLPHDGKGIDLEALNTLACPSADECYCRLYGRCGLKGCSTPGRCQGQYRLPPKLTLPVDWASTHS